MAIKKMLSPSVTAAAGLLLVGLSLGGAGCRDGKSPGSRGSAMPLPRWVDVDPPVSGGAPNRSIPTLVVNHDGSICSKSFYGGVAGPPGDAFQLRHGYMRYWARWRDKVKDAGVPIQCPEGIAAAAAAAHAKALLWSDVPVLRPRPKLLRWNVGARAERGLSLRVRPLASTITRQDAVG